MERDCSTQLLPDLNHGARPYLWLVMACTLEINAEAPIS
jgi:hypothetical protein